MKFFQKNPLSVYKKITYPANRGNFYASRNYIIKIDFASFKNNFVIGEANTQFRAYLTLD